MTEGKSEEQLLLEACLRGEKPAQRKLFDRLSPKMFALCLRYMGERGAAEDVLQDGFVTLFSKLESYSANGSFEGWARKIFVNTALMSLRRTDALKLSEPLDTVMNMGGPQLSQIRELGYKELLKLIATLPASYRTVFNMFVIEGFSHKEIAEALGITEALSRSHLYRARMILQEKIKEL